MDWTRDGRLVIATWGGSDKTLGEVYIVDNVDREDEPEQGRRTRRSPTG